MNKIERFSKFLNLMVPSKQLEDFYAHFISWSTVPSVSPKSALDAAYRPKRLDLQLNALIVSKVGHHLCQIVFTSLFRAFLFLFPQPSSKWLHLLGVDYKVQ